MAYERFGRDVNSINIHDSAEDAAELIRKSLNITFEWNVLIEAQHVIDELQIMQEIFTQQITVMRDFEEALKSLGINPYTLERAVMVIRDMEMRKDELAGLERLQAKTRAQVRAMQHPSPEATLYQTADNKSLATGAARHETAASWNHRGQSSHQAGR